jgi:hypothetical protein
MKLFTQWVLALGCAMMTSGSALAQSKPAAGAFDGKYVGESIRCFPAGRMLARISFYTVSGNKFSHRFTFDGEPRSCSLSIGTDGTFNNKDCGVPTSGKIVGNRMDVEFKSPEAICNVVLKRGQ